ncbi:uncharacterized PE-PGRS family protein PE_PGRS54-like [Amphibalanus amphitrite]|nr:uncharacterized PE-PGRS family protein PE_PGRS54-like [Amphibalanus amphitrite]
MFSAHLLLICVACAAAVPVPSYKDQAPPTEPPPPPPPSEEPPAPRAQPQLGLSSKSRQRQTGYTRGGAAVSSTGATQGAGSLDLAIDGPGGFKARSKALVNSGVSGAAVAAGNGGFKQKSESETVGTVGLQGLDISTSSRGAGKSFGTAGVTQKQGANGGVSGAARVGGKSGHAKVAGALKGSATSSSGLDATSSGDSKFKGANAGKTSVKFNVPSPDDALPSGVAPNIGVDSDSLLKQQGGAVGDASISTNGGTQGGGSLVAGLRAPGLQIDGSAAAKSGVSGAGALVGDGGFAQESIAGTSSSGRSDGLSVKSRSNGRGSAVGKVATRQGGSTSGGISGSIVTGLGTPDGKFSIKGKHKGAAKGSIGHSASTDGTGSFSAINAVGTDVKFDVPSPDLALPGQGGLPSAPADTPVFKLTSTSDILQKGGSQGGAAVSGAGSTQGSGLGTVDLDTPHLQLDGEVVANSGVSGTAGSQGHGLFGQDANARTDAIANADGIETRTRTGGRGVTEGRAATAQKTGANGAIKARRDIVAQLPGEALGVSLPKGKGKQAPAVRVGSKAQGTSASSSGHGASSSGDGRFKTENDRGTKVQLTDPLTG